MPNRRSAPRFPRPPVDLVALQKADVLVKTPWAWNLPRQLDRHADERAPHSESTSQPGRHPHPGEH